ncbi:MAG: hypothetical protein ABIV48_10060 [Pyrinomonadaceae bacterium]
MFCPKCGGHNPEEGKFCRSCGTDLGNVSGALSSKPQSRQLVNHKGKPIHWEGAITKIFTGVAFLIISIALAFTAMGRTWWFWMLIPAFGSIGSGIAQYMQLRRAERGEKVYVPEINTGKIAEPENSALPPGQTERAAPESRYKTGDLAPASVTDNTTRHLELDKEGQTMTLPKK